MIAVALVSITPRTALANLPVEVEPHLHATMSVADQRHLLLRTGIGASPSQLLALDGLTRAEGIARIIDGLRTEPSSSMPAWTERPLPHYHARADMTLDARARFDIDRDRELGELRNWWFREMLMTDSPQTERLVVFWHDLFATSYQGTDRRSLAMAKQNATFRTLASGSWEALLKAMIRDPALLDYLDNESNRAASPNENLGRELLELFTLGEGNYSQRDVSEAARALTGHGISDIAGLAFRLHTWNQDRNDKILFGQAGVYDGDDLIERVLARPAAARFLATRFWQAFVADGMPDPNWLAAQADAFRAADHDIATLYTDTLSSEAFWAPQHRGAIVRSPLDLIIGTARSLDYPKQHWQQFARWQADLGMNLFAPPDVAGWREGDAWLASGALLDRRRVLARLAAAPDRGADDEDPRSMTGSMEASMGVAGKQGVGLALRLAAEDYRGAVMWQVTLRRGDQVTWQDRPRALANGQDTERDGRLAGGADMPWQTVTIDAPDAVLADADSVEVAFLNDAAGSDGDRNLFVDGVFWNGQWRAASFGRQQGECAPDDAAGQGKLYCAGSLFIDRPEATEPAATASSAASEPLVAASAVHVRWSYSDPDHDRHVARIALDDARVPAGDYHRLQFLLLADADRAIEFRLDSFDCVPDCLVEWPACAWADENFPAARTIGFGLDVEVSTADDACHVESLAPAMRETFRIIGHALPAVFEKLADTATGKRATETLTVIRSRLRTEPDSGESSIAIDARFAAPALPPAAPAAPRITVASPEQLLAVLRAADLSLFDVLLAGFDDAALTPLQPRVGDTPLAALMRIIDHPGFQVR